MRAIAMYMAGMPHIRDCGRIWTGMGGKRNDGFIGFVLNYGSSIAIYI
jgi:hypothetical protein